MPTIRLDGTVGWDITAADLSERMSGQKSVSLIVNSPGGSVTEGFAIYNVIKGFSGRVDVHVDFAASMASLFILAADSVSMKESSSLMMIHRPWGGAVGNSEELRNSADTLDKMEDMMLGIYSDKSGLDRDTVSQMLDDETYMTASEALEFGFIDSIESGKGDLAAVAMMAMRATDKVSFDCTKLVAKIDDIKGHKKPIRCAFDACSGLPDVEAVMRNDFSLSRAEATAIVAAVRKFSLGDQEKRLKEKQAIDTLKDFKFSF